MTAPPQRNPNPVSYFPEGLDPDRQPPPPTRLLRRAAARGRGWPRVAAAYLTRPARLLPGLAALGCAVAGSWLLWGVGVALLVAVPFLLAVDARTPRG